MPVESTDPLARSLGLSPADSVKAVFSRAPLPDLFETSARIEVANAISLERIATAQENVPCSP